MAHRVAKFGQYIKLKSLIIDHRPSVPPRSPHSDLHPIFTSSLCDVCDMQPISYSDFASRIFGWNSANLFEIPTIKKSDIIKDHPRSTPELLNASLVLRF